MLAGRLAVRLALVTVQLLMVRLEHEMARLEHVTAQLEQSLGRFVRLEMQLVGRTAPGRRSSWSSR